MFRVGIRTRPALSARCAVTSSAASPGRRRVGRVQAHVAPVPHLDAFARYVRASAGFPVVVIVANPLRDDLDACMLPGELAQERFELREPLVDVVVQAAERPPKKSTRPR